MLIVMRVMVDSASFMLVIRLLMVTAIDVSSTLMAVVLNDD